MVPVVSRILLVDDESVIRNLLSIMLIELGYDVEAAAGPDEALSLVAKKTFHIAFVDNLLGPMEGIDLVAQLNKLDPDLQCVIMTGNPNVETAIRSLKIGVSDFLRKPFCIEDLLVSIDHVNRKLAFERRRKELLAGLELRVQEKTDELKQVYLSVLVALSRTVEKKDLGTYGHSMRVSELSVRIAERLGLLKNEIETVRAASLLHDIGKIGIGDCILAKQGPLTAEELDSIRSHPQKGVEILEPLKQFASLIPAILHHHERYDGSGYPAGISGDAIPLSARIIAVADTYDAILSDRPYRTAASHASAVDELNVWSGKQFDARVVEAFKQIVKKGSVNYIFAESA